MKKKIIYTLLFILVIAASYFVVSDSDKTFFSSLDKITANDVHKITKIEISDLKNKIVLSKEDERWVVGDMYMVNNKHVEELLLALEKINKNNPLSILNKKKISNQINKQVNVVVFNKNRILVNFKIGKIFEGNKIGIMSVNKNIPFELSNLEWQRSPLTYFSTDFDYWQSKNIITDVENIVELNLKYYSKKEKSFKINKTNGGFKIETLNYKKTIPPYLWKNYMNKIKNVSIYKYEKKITDDLKKRIFKKPMLFELKVKYKNQTVIIKGYEKIKKQINQEKLIDPDFLYLLINNDKIAQAKYYDLYFIFNTNIFLQ